LAELTGPAENPDRLTLGSPPAMLPTVLDAHDLPPARILPLGPW
jgi:hypothetical protein